MANWKLGGGGCAPKRAIKHLEREYKEIGGAYKVAPAQVFQIEPAPELRPWLNARPNKVPLTLGNDYQLDTDLANPLECSLSVQTTSGEKHNIYLAPSSGFLSSRLIERKLRALGLEHLTS